MRQHNRAHSLVGDMDSPKVVGNRLYKIRHIAGYPGVNPKTGLMRAWAEKVGLPPKSYAQWESGSHGHIRVWMAIKICEWSGNQIDLDYIYRGRFEDLRGSWVRDLADAPDRPAFSKSPRPPRATPARKRSAPPSKRS